MNTKLDAIKGGLIVSCQPVIGGPLDRPDFVAAMALAALHGGASGLRIEGIANLHAVRAVTDAPIIGLIKRDLDGFTVRITPIVTDVKALIVAGADFIAVDATGSPRPMPVDALIGAVRSAGALAMADCATVEDGRLAARAGADVVASTLAGYTGGSVPDQPDLALVRALGDVGCPVIAEGRYHRPEQAAEALKAGAHAVVVGSAITRLEHVTGWFVDAMRGATAPGA